MITLFIFVKRIMISKNQIRTKYQELLLEEFVDAPKLWRASLNLTNSLIDHLNLISNKQHKHYSYNEFCVNSIQVITNYLDNFLFDELYRVEECDVHSINPLLAKLFKTRDYNRLYQKASEELIKDRILCLEKDVHKACSFDVIKRLAGKQYQEFENSFERVYLSPQ